MGGIKMLISARMLEIVKHLYQYKTTTYKEIEQSLGIKPVFRSYHYIF